VPWILEEKLMNYSYGTKKKPKKKGKKKPVKKK